MTCSLVIVAAGHSTRFGSNKQLALIHDIPLIIRTCLFFSTLSSISNCVLVTQDPTAMQSLLAQYQLTTISCVQGGSTRQDSVKQGLAALIPTQHVMIHDGARPCVSRDLIKRLWHHSNESDGVIPTLPVTDTIKRVTKNYVSETIDRSILHRVQTPQLFKWDVLQQAYQHTHQQYTDDAALVESIGGCIRVVSGCPHNIKVTTPHDLAIAETYYNTPQSR